MTEKIETRNCPFLGKDRPPRIRAEGGDVDMIDPKAAVMEMLKKMPEKEMFSAQEEATKDKQETVREQQEPSLMEKKKNREIWGIGMLERLKKAIVAVEHWGDTGSENFWSMIS